MLMRYTLAVICVTWLPVFADDCETVGEATNLMATIDRGCADYKLTKKGKQAFDTGTRILHKMPDGLACLERTKASSMKRLVQSYPKFAQLNESDSEAKYLSVVCDAAAQMLGSDLVKDVE